MDVKQIDVMVADASHEVYVDKILDTAGQKGTGKWTSESALDLGAPAPTIAEAVCLLTAGLFIFDKFRNKHKEQE